MGKRRDKNQTNPYVLELGIKHDTLKSVWDKGLDFVIRAQVVIDGTKTGWAQQYEPDAVDPVPAGGRAFELPSVSPDESLTMVKVLTNIVNPSDAVKEAITSYVNWINSVGYYRLWYISTFPTEQENSVQTDFS